MGYFFFEEFQFVTPERSVFLWFTSLTRNQFFPLIDKIFFIGSIKNLVSHQDLLVDDFHSSPHFYTAILGNNFTNKKMAVENLSA